ncbi:DUF4258 domain-containing protein [Crocosphaera sp. XPORK-15E]|uniref:DUF4258 domain-containing protein n=1 Tax=Crocosphaera sp. XPORK-15E TaxID=3110247 RepID=UPI002B203ED2|nr:DUF4258 domain-containing protein [Crocosphaera sp. XPORK-15E]MEA5536147.1 DUF4258 domain-containing protein [Crocosphaera sp. XPORK-15E]
MNLKHIIEAILDYRFWITDHADEEAEEDQLSFDEIYHSVLYGEIIENYPHHQPYPRCLIYGKTSQLSRFIASGIMIKKQTQLF